MSLDVSSGSTSLAVSSNGSGEEVPLPSDHVVEAAQEALECPISDDPQRGDGGRLLSGHVALNVTVEALASKRIIARHLIGVHPCEDVPRLEAALDWVYVHDKRAYVRVAGMVIPKPMPGTQHGDGDGGKQPRIRIRQLVALMERGPTALRADGSVIPPGQEPAALAQINIPPLPGIDQGEDGTEGTPPLTIPQESREVRNVVATVGTVKAITTVPVVDTVPVGKSKKSGRCAPPQTSDKEDGGLPDGMLASGKVRVVEP